MKRKMLAMLIALVFVTPFLVALDGDFYEPMILTTANATVSHGYITVHAEGDYPFGCAWGEVRITANYHRSPIQVAVSQFIESPGFDYCISQDSYSDDITLSRQFDPGIYRIDINGIVLRVVVP